MDVKHPSHELDVPCTLVSSHAQTDGMPTVMAAPFRARADVHGPDGAYVVHLDSHGDKTVACLSRGDPKVYTTAVPGGIRFEAALDHGGRRASRASFVDGNVLATSSDEDGCLRIWDLRSKQVVMLCQSTRGALWCHDVPADVPTMAAGGDAVLLLWDRRKPGKPVAEREDVHADAITRVRFHPGRRERLVSAGVDGLICVTDSRADLEEDDAVEAIVSADTSIADFGFFGRKGNRLWVTTHIETVQMFKWDGEPESYEPRAKLDNARDIAAQAWGHASSASEGRYAKGSVDYLVGCAWDSQENSLYLHAGNAAGDIVEFPLHKKGTLGMPKTVLQGAHTQVVRSLVRTPCPGIAFVTGAEDSSICLWSPTVLEQGLHGTAHAPERTQKTMQNRHSPY